MPVIKVWDSNTNSWITSVVGTQGATGATGPSGVIAVTAPITNSGTSTSASLAINDGTTSQKGAVQLTDSISSTSTTTAATPNSVKSAYDLANGAIAKSLVNAKGDLIVATANDTPAVLTVGADGRLLIADSTQTSGLNWSGPFQFTPKSGHYFRGIDNQTSAATTQDRLTFTRVILQKAVSIDRIGVNVNTGAAGSTIRLGAYASDTNGYPGALLFDAGTVDSSGTGFLTITISKTIGPGLVHLAAVAQGGTPNVKIVTNNSIYTRPFQTGTTSGSDLVALNPSFFWQAGVTGPLPDPAVVSGDASATAVSQAIAVAVRAA